MSQPRPFEDGPIKVQVLRLRGELNLEDLVKIRNLLEQYVRANLVFVVLDLEQVTHIHLAGLPGLQQAALRLREYGGGLKLASLSPYLKHILQLAGMGESLDVVDDVDAAAVKFQNQGRRWAHNGGRHDAAQ